MDAFSTIINNDDNNVHDRTVNELSKCYYQFIRDNTTLDYDLDDIIKCVNKSYSEKSNRKQLILNYLNFLLLNNDNIVNFNCSEYDFIILCWNRAYDKSNRSNRNLIKKNILFNIVDFYENDYDFEHCVILKRLCCTSGRVMKILSSFYKVDSNEELGGFLSNGMLKQEFYANASKLYYDGINRLYYNELLDDLILTYDSKYKQQLIVIKNELISCFFITYL